MDTGTCQVCRGPCGKMAKYCHKCYAELNRKRALSRHHRLYVPAAQTEEGDRRRFNRLHGTGDTDKVYLTPPPRSGYCYKCRIIRLSKVNVSGICDGCADDAAADKRRKAAETFKVRSAKAGIE
jgi:hypothetical protein